MLWEVKCSEESPDCPKLRLVPAPPPLPFLPKVGHLPIDILIERTRKKNIILPVELANTGFLPTKLEYQMFFKDSNYFDS